MPITISYDLAAQRLQEAIGWASDLEQPVPVEWFQVTETVAQGPSRTLIAGLGTSLLAKATDAQVDALAIKAQDDYPNSFSLRTLCERVLVPGSKGDPPFHLGARGPQPTNNQPYFRYSHLNEVVRHKAGPTLDYLRDWLEELNLLDEDGALAALAAFLRSRMEAERYYLVQVATKLPTVQDVQELLDALDAFLAEEQNNDRPLRLQAVVGGLVRATGASVSAQVITDPSRHAPGDVHVPDSEIPMWVAEVKAREIPIHEAIGFLDRAREHGIPAVWIVAIADGPESLDRVALLNAARDRGLLLTVIEDVVELVAAVLSHPMVDSRSIPDAAKNIGKQLRDMGASGKTLEAWSDQFPLG